MAPLLPLLSETSARPIGSSQKNLHRLRVFVEEGLAPGFGATPMIFFCGAGGRSWPGAGAAPVNRGVRSLGSTCRRGDVADRRGPRHASPLSAIEASSAVAVVKLDGAD
jgi:hypothetical protein